MRKITTHTGTAAAIKENGRLMANIDTDMIIPKQFLKTLTRKGLGKGLFHELRTRSDGSPNPDFVLNQMEASEASILIAGDNFGCGSSREHAPWALIDHGIVCVIAPSFADIFHTNCLKNGLLPVCLTQEECEYLAELAGGGNRLFNINLPAQTICAPDGQAYAFQIDPGVKENLLHGQDEIAQTLEQEAAISAFERKQHLRQPWAARQIEPQ